MKAVETLCHPDTVSGTTILDDGRRVHWTEGRGSDVVVCEAGPGPGGLGGARIDRFEADEDNDVMRELNAGWDSQRAMTECEVKDWQSARDFN